MNTVSKNITSTFLTAEQRPQVIARWRDGFDRPQSAAYHLLYALLLGRDWRRAFTPYTNTTTLANGIYDHWAFWRAYHTLRSFVPTRPTWMTDNQWLTHCTATEQRRQHFLAPFAGTVTSEMLQAAVAFLPVVQQEQFSGKDFAPGHWPFEAYVLPAIEVARAS